MLTAHVDIEVLVDAKRKFETDPYTRPRDFIDLINKNSHLVLYGNPSEDEYRLLSQMLAGRGESLIRMESEASCSKAEVDTRNPFQLFFAIQNNFTAKIRSNFLSAFISDYEEKFNKLNLDSYIRVGDPVSVRLLNAWSDLSPEIFVSDVILVDPYIMKTDNEAELENNLFEFLRNLKTGNELRSFLIFTRFKNQDSAAVKINKKYILDKCHEILGKKTIIGIIYFERELEEHDRYLFMNYQYIYSGNSFSSVFNSSGQTRNSNSSSVRIHSLINPVNCQQMNDVLSRINKSLGMLQHKQEHLRYLDSRLFYWIERATKIKANCNFS